MKKFLSLLFVIAITLCSLISAIPVNAAEAGTEYYLDGIGTDKLKHFSFYYTTAPSDAADPTAGMVALSKPGRQPVDNGCWPFDFAYKVKAYDEPSWKIGVPGIDSGTGKDGYALVYYADAQYLFMYAMHKNNVNYRSIVAFTAPVGGKYNISFGGSLGWSPDSMSVNAWLNGSKVSGSNYVFSTVQGPDDLGNPDCIKPYSLDVTLKAGEKLCLVFEVLETENRANVENLTATLVEPSNDPNDTIAPDDSKAPDTSKTPNGNGSDDPVISSPTYDHDGTIEVEVDVTVYAVIAIISLAVALISLLALVLVVLKNKR